MRLVEVSEFAKQKMNTVSFLGYNHNLSIKDGEFYDMKNLCSDEYPLLTVRKPRGTVQQLVKPNGLHSAGKICYVDGTNFYYDGTVKGTVADSKKQLISMGAYILIFPDKKYYNTASGEFGSLENSKTVSCTISTDTITGTGIGVGFKPDDSITISGSSVVSNNKTAKVIAVTNDSLKFTANCFTTAPSGTITCKRTVPDMEYFTENENRLWGCSSIKHEIYACKLGDPTNWNSIEGISTDSFILTVGSEGNFTGAATHLGFVCFFKENHILRLQGTKPRNYQLFDTQCLGVREGCYQSLVAINGVLFYLSINGVCAYSGGMPEVISNPLGNITYIDAIGGSLNNKYYISMKDLNNKWNLFIYDCLKGLWFKEDAIHAEFMKYFSNRLYYVDNSNKKLMTVVGEDNEAVSFQAITRDYTGKLCGSNYVSKIMISSELNINDMLSIYIQYDNSKKWELIKTVIGDRKKNETISIRPKRCEYYRIKLEGFGKVIIYGIVTVVNLGSDVNVRN